MEKCYVYDDDIIKLRENELCAVVSYQSIQKHLFEAHIHFSFLLKKNCKETISMPKGMCNGLKKDILIHKTAPYSMPNKGSMKGNNIRKGASVPIVSGIGGGVLKKDTPISIAIQMEEILKSNSKAHPPDYSSINKSENVHTFQSPVHSKAAINRNDEEDVKLFQIINIEFTYIYFHLNRCNHQVELVMDVIISQVVLLNHTK